MYNFDEIIDRNFTANIKYDLRDKFFGKDDVMPMWVADMDFETPDFIRNAVSNRAKHPIYGYSFREDSYYSSIINWVQRRHDWKIKQEWIVFSPGIVPALNFSTLAYTKPRAGIIIPPPVSFPFFTAIALYVSAELNNQRILDNNPYVI